MEKYTDITKKYIKANFRRTVLTTIGCALVAMVIYAFLNSFNNYILAERQSLREITGYDWEILVYNDSKEVAEAIVNESFVRSASMGDTFETTEYLSDDAVTSNSIYLNVKNIYKVRKYGEYLQNTYGVTIRYNEDVLNMYLIDFDGDMWLAVLFGIFISYIFAIIGIGIIRNSISIAAIERLRDYGEMRCIGATKSQVRRIVFRESLIQEGVGVLAGIILGYIISIFFCLRYDFPIGFHIVPAIMVAACFLFDLYFVVSESTKKIISVQPVDAVRGNYRIKLGRVRRERSGLWSLIFGVEGAYAYKNVRRNRLRFIKSVAAISFGIATVVVISNSVGFMLNFTDKMNNVFGYYQDYLEGASEPFYTKDEVKSTLYSPDQIRAIRDTDGIKEINYIYMTKVYTEKTGEIHDRLTDKYLLGDGVITFDGVTGNEENVRPYDQLSEEEEKVIDEDSYNNLIERNRAAYAEFKERWDESFDKGEGLLDYDSICFPNGQAASVSYLPEQLLERSEIKIYGYSDRDWERYRDSLVEGTIDVSDRGVVLVNSGYLYDEYLMTMKDSVLLSPEMVTFTNYKVGDEITFVDPEELNRLVLEEMKRASEYDAIHVPIEEEWQNEHDEDWKREHREEYKAHVSYLAFTEQGAGRKWIVEAAREKLISEGKCKTYVIEGIVEGDANHWNYGPALVMPLNNYMAATGCSEGDYTGFQFHIKNALFSDTSSVEYLSNTSVYNTELFNESGELIDRELWPTRSQFLHTLMMPMFIVKPLIYGSLIIMIIVIVNCLNIINVTVGNLALRRNEFAQLRAIGMTKSGLFKTVMLEGFIMWLTACIIGVAIGGAVQYMIYKNIMRFIIEQEFTFNIIPIIFAMLLSLAVLCGAYYFPMKRMRLDVAEELMRSGE